MIYEGEQLLIEEVAALEQIVEEEPSAPPTYKNIGTVITNPDSSVALANMLVERMPDLGLNARKLFDALVASLPNYPSEKNINRSEADYKYVKIYVKDLVNSIGWDPKVAYEITKNCLEELSRNPFKISYINKNGKPAVFSTSLIAAYHYKIGEGSATVEFSSALFPWLCVLKEQFTTYKLGVSYKFTSAHAHRIYQLLAQYRTVKSRRFEIEEFKKLLYIENKYKNNNYNLRKKVIEPAINDINRSSDLIVRYSCSGKGAHTIIEFSFVVKKDFTKQNKERLYPSATSEEILLLIDLITNESTINDIIGNEKEVKMLCKYALSFFPDDNDARVSEAFSCMKEAMREFQRRSFETEITKPTAYYRSILKAECKKRSVAY